MSLPAPILDDRNFQQIVDEVRKRIPLYCPEWTDHNLSDPGITLIELFAWMTDLLIYRLNRVPELHYIKFMEFLGYQLRSPAAAQTWVTFWLARPLTTITDPDNKGLTLATGVEVSTTQTETTTPTIFAVEEKFVMRAPTFKSVVIERTENNKLQKRALQTSEFVSLTSGLAGINLFSAEPRDDEAVYFGFDNMRSDLHYHILSLTLTFERKSGIGVNTDYPPYVWEAYSDTGEWRELKRTGRESTTTRRPDAVAELDRDTTLALNEAGEVVLLLPRLGKIALAGQNAQLHWVRVRVIAPTPEQEAEGMRRFKETPYLRHVPQVATVGATVSAASARVATQEFLGESDGSAGQRFYLSGTPVLLPLRPDECLRVKTDDHGDRDEELWRYVESFVDSTERSQHFTLDSMSGEVRFGPAIRQPNGEIKSYGKTPPRNARLLFERYRYLGNLGDAVGGVKANVPKKSIDVLRTSIPYVDRVENRLPAVGGIDGQSLESAQLAVQRLIRTRRLLITPDDYEARVQEQFFDRVGRVKCLPVTTEPKTNVRILLIPALPPSQPENPYGYLTNADLHVPSPVRGEVDAYLNQRRMLAVQVQVENCTYRRVRVVASLRLKEGAAQRRVEQNALRRLHTLLNPVTGGVQGRGWPFERTLTDAEVKEWLTSLAEVQAVDKVELQEVEDVGPNRTAEVDQRIKARGIEIKLGIGEMVVSGHHQINWVR